MMRVLWRQVAMNVMMTLEYRGGFLIYMVNNVLAPLISLLVWLTVGAQGVQLPYDRGQFVTYYVLLSLVSMLTSTWLGSYLADDIRRGGLNPWLLRPAPYIAHYIGNNIGEKIVKLPLLLPLAALMGLAFRADLHLPSSPGRWLLFALSLPLAAALTFLLEAALGSLAFWMQSTTGFFRARDLAAAFLSGQYVPLALFPPGWGGFLEAQPFRYMVSFPLEVLTGSLPPAAVARGFAWQAGYCVAIWACYRAIWRLGLRSYTAPGG